MNLKKSVLSLALASLFSTGTVQALHQTPEIITMDFNGLMTFLEPGGAVMQNQSLPYYDDTTWGYGVRTQISGSITVNQFTGLGSVTINPFAFFQKGEMVISDFNFKPANDGGLLIGNFNSLWNSNNTTNQIVLDATGLFTDLSVNTQVGDTFNSASCASSNACATPATEGVAQGDFPIGPVPIATSSFNTTGQTGVGTTLSQLSLGTDDGIGGSPQDNGPTSGFILNFDFTDLTVTATSAVPIPAAVWLFGSGIAGLACVARRRKKSVI